jgi:hypothetical protein
LSTVQFQLGGTLKFLIEEPKGYVLVTVQYDRFTLTAKGDVMAYKLPDDKQAKVQVAYVDAKGHPASVDGDVTWSSSNEGVALVQVDPADSTIATVVPGDQLGQVQVTATADADLGAGVTELVTLMDVEVIGGQAVAGTITPVGEATPIS